METPLRTDFFRCFDPKLVEIVSGREVEAAMFAAAAYQSGLCDGIFVNGDAIDNWEFLEITKCMSRFVFNKPSKSLSNVDFSLLSNAERFKLVSQDFSIDLNNMPRLVDLCLQWHQKHKGLENLDHLRTLQLLHVGRSAKSLPVLPSGLTELQLSYYAQETLQSENTLDNLETLEIFSARNLVSLPELRKLKFLSLSHINNSFSYASLPSSIESLELIRCPPITDWQVLSHLTLHSLDVTSTETPRERFPRLVDSVA